MSIASEITRLQGVKSNILAAIEAKNVIVPPNAALADCPLLIDTISGGGADNSNKVMLLNGVNDYEANFLYDTNLGDPILEGGPGGLPYFSIENFKTKSSTDTGVYIVPTSFRQTWANNKCMTIEYWFKRSDYDLGTYGESAFFNELYDDESAGSQLGNPRSKTYWRTSPSLQEISTNTWHHVAITMLPYLQNQNLWYRILFIDGVWKTSTSSGSDNKVAKGLKFAKNSGGVSTDLCISQIVVWNYARYMGNFTPSTELL